MSLSLVQRRNIQDAEVKMQKHLGLIESVSGIKFTVEIDFEKIVADPKLSQSYKDSIGSIIYDQYLGELSLGFKSFCQEPLQKEAVNELATAKQITFAIYENKQDWDAAINKPGSPDYCRSRLNNDGVLVMEVLSGKWPTNVVKMRDGLLETFSGLAGKAEGTALSLACRVDISKNAKALQDCLNELEKASGSKLGVEQGEIFQVEVDYLALLNSIAATKRKQVADSLGQFVLTYIKSLVKECLIGLRNELNKEAFNELCTTKKIKFLMYEDVAAYEKAAPRVGGAYGRARVIEGDLVIELNNTNFYTNIPVIFKFDKIFSA